MRVQILKCVWSDELQRTLAPGEVVDVDAVQGAGYIDAGYAAPVNAPEQEAE